MKLRGSLAATLLAASLFCVLQRGCASDVKKLGDLKTRAGIPLNRFVPPALLKGDEAVDILTAHYRLVGTGADLDRALANADRFESAFFSLYRRARYHVHSDGVQLGPSNAVPLQQEGGNNVAACYETDSIDGISTAQRIAAQNTGLDFNLTIGVTRDTLHIDMGGPEWAYSKIVQTILQEAGFDVAVMHMYLDLLPAGAQILKHVPSSAMYSEETVLQLTEESSSQQASLLPFDGGKQNLLLRILDAVGLQNSAGIGRINITAVSQSCAFQPGSGHQGIAKVTVVTQRDKPAFLFPQAFLEATSRVMEAFAEEGVLLESVEVLSSRDSYEFSLQTKIAEAVGDREPVRSFETRISADKVPRWGAEATDQVPLRLGSGILMTLASVVAAVVCLAGSLLYVRLRLTWPSAKAAAEPAAAWSPTAVGSKLHKSAATITPAHSESNANLIQASVDSSAKQGVSSDGLDPANAFTDLLNQPFGVRPPFSDNGPDQAADSNSSSSGGGQGSLGAWSSARLLLDSGRPDESSSTEAESILSEHGAVPRRQSAHDAWRQKSLDRVDSIYGWKVREDEIRICKRPNGSDWLLGFGGYGMVYKGIRDGLQDVACKVLHEGDALHEQQFALEIKLQKSLSFDNNVVQFLGAARYKGRPMLILEYMEGGDLFKALHSPNGKLPSLRWRDHGQHIALDIVRGLAFLHKHGVLHGDLKSHNVLLGRNAAYAKLSDVGMSRIISTDVNSQSMNPDGIGWTFAFAAPELLLGLKCTAKADIFSLGVLLWEIVTHEVPRRGRMRDMRVPDECSEEVAQLVERCCSYEPRQRPTCQEIFECIQRGIEAEANDADEEGGQERQ